MPSALNVFKFKVYVICLFLNLVLWAATSSYKAYQGNYPYVASLRYNNVEIYCTGAVITSKYVMSAFDCVAEYNAATEVWIKKSPHQIIVVAGLLDLYTDRLSTQRRHGASIRGHKHCELPRTANLWTNLVLIELQNPLVFRGRTTSWIKPIQIFSLNDEFKLKELFKFMLNNPSQNCYTVGWGITQVPATIPSSLMHEIPTTLKNCTYSNCSTDASICHVKYNRVICGAFVTPSKHYCGGHRGNLLVCSGKVFGLVSKPSTCPETQSVYIPMDACLSLIHQVYNGENSVHDEITASNLLILYILFNLGVRILV